ncbi:MAG: divalent-cation tolerance protein CutA [Verrucomicrobia bacterium]|nr:divalent-cation tolerance protein CutA [Verrucomicrobiota bacterium]
MKIAWTTTETLDQAKTLANLAIEKKLAVCAQISSPILSIYQWKGEIEESTEHRITFKLLKSNQEALQKLIIANHPYDTPQWVAANLSDVGDGYRTWAEG